MRIPKIEFLLIFDHGIISGLLYYIVRPNFVEALLCFGIVLILQIGLYFLLKKILVPKNKK